MLCASSEPALLGFLGARKFLHAKAGEEMPLARAWKVGVTWGHTKNSTFIYVPWLFQNLSEQENRMEAAAALGTGDLLAGVSAQPSLAEDLNS